jgi:hypothetical protein
MLAFRLFAQKAHVCSQILVFLGIRLFRLPSFLHCRIRRFHFRCFNIASDLAMSDKKSVSANGSQIASEPK